MFPVTATPLLLLSLAMIGLSQNRLCFLHSKEPMIEQPTIPVPSLFCQLVTQISKKMKKILHFITTLLHSTFHHCPHISSKGAFPHQMSTSFTRLSTQFTCWINLYLPPKKIISCKENIGASSPQKHFNFRRYFQAQILFHHFLSSGAFESSSSTYQFK